MHLLPKINCFDIVGENDAQTEGTLRARFEKAAACAPCILTLRHIDALAGTTQALETGRSLYLLPLRQASPYFFGSQSRLSAVHFRRAYTSLPITGN